MFWSRRPRVGGASGHTLRVAPRSLLYFSCEGRFWLQISRTNPSPKHDMSSSCPRRQILSENMFFQKYMFAVCCEPNLWPIWAHIRPPGPRSTNKRLASWILKNVIDQVFLAKLLSGPCHQQQVFRFKGRTRPAFS